MPVTGSHLVLLVSNLYQYHRSSHMALLKQATKVEQCPLNFECSYWDSSCGEFPLLFKGILAHWSLYNQKVQYVFK